MFGVLSTRVQLSMLEHIWKQPNTYPGWVHYLFRKVRVVQSCRIVLERHDNFVFWRGLKERKVGGGKVSDSRGLVGSSLVGPTSRTNL